MKNILLLTFAFLMLYSFSIAQDTGGDPTGSGSTKFTVSVMFGKDNFLDGLSVPGSVTNWSTYGSSFNVANRLKDLVNTEASAINMVAIKARAFVTEEIAISLSGGARIVSNPSQEFIQGYHPALSVGGNATIIPDKVAVPETTDFVFNASVGSEYHFRRGNFSPFVGIGIPFYYARKSAYDPTYKVEKVGTDVNIKITDVGVRISEMFGFGANITAGVDYYLKDNLYFGFEIKPFSFVYAYGSEYPAPGLPAAKSDAFAYGVFSQPFFKLGFVF